MVRARIGRGSTVFRGVICSDFLGLKETLRMGDDATLILYWRLPCLLVRGLLFSLYYLLGLGL